KVGLLMALESSGARAEQLARQIIVHGRPIPIDEIVGKVDAVTVESTRAAGRALIARSPPAVAAVGPPGLHSAAALAESLPRGAAQPAGGRLGVLPSRRIRRDAARDRGRAGDPAPAANVGLFRMGDAAREEPRIFRAVGADLARG